MSEPSPLSAAQRDARLRRDSGDLAGATATLDDALARVRPVYGADHPEVLATAHQLARLHREAGDPADARRVLEEALAAGQRRLDDSDPLLLAISFDLGTVAEELGNRHEARRNFGRVATAGPATLGPDHWAVRAARRYLGQDPSTAPLHEAGAPPTGAPPTGAQPTGAAQPSFQRPAREPAHQQPTHHQPTHHQPTTQRAGQQRAGQQQVGQRQDRYPALARREPVHLEPVTVPPPGGPATAVPVPPAVAPSRRGRGATVAAGVAAVAAIAAAVLAGFAVLRDDGEAPPAGGGTSTAPVSIDGEPPADVRVTRDGDALLVTWTDPAPGRVSFVITGGKVGEELRFVGQLPSGAPPRFPVHGFNPSLGYCFQVAAVYSTTELGVAQPVCTDRATATPAG